MIIDHLILIGALFVFGFAIGFVIAYTLVVAGGHRL
jgi:hypothetical protein